MKTNAVKMTPLVRHSKKTDAWNIEASPAVSRESDARLVSWFGANTGRYPACPASLNQLRRRSN